MYGTVPVEGHASINIEIKNKKEGHSEGFQRK